MRRNKSQSHGVDISQSEAPQLIKFGFLSTYTETSKKWLGCLCFIIFNLQTCGLYLKNAYLYLKQDSNSAEKILREFIQWTTFTEIIDSEDDTLFKIVGPILLSYLIHILIVGIYLNHKLRVRKPIPKNVQAYWSIISSVHPLMFFFPIHAFSLQVTEYINDGTLSAAMDAGLKVVYYMVVVLNFLISHIFSQVFQTTIKTKDCLSAKNSYIRLKDIEIKSLVPILWIVGEDHEWLQIGILVLTFIDAITRDYMLFYHLPYYHICLLRLGSIAQAILTCLSGLTLAAKALEDTEFKTGLLFASISWIFLAPIFAKIYHNTLKRIFFHITSLQINKSNVHYMLHQGIILRYMMKNKTILHSEAKKIDFNWYIQQGKLQQLSNNWQESAQQLGEDKEFFFSCMRNSLEKTCQEYPSSHLARLTLAHAYIKHHQSYILANSLIKEVLNSSTSFATRISSSLIRFELQRKLFMEYANENNQEDSSHGLNILNYVQTNKANEELKIQMKKQIKLQVSFWENYISSESDMGTLVNLAINVSKQRKIVKKTWSRFVRVNQLKYTFPNFIYGMYLSFANNNTSEGEGYMNQYNTDTERRRKLAESDELSNDTLMSNSTVSISMSGSRKQLGKVIDCTSNIHQYFNWKKDFLIGRSINILMPAFYQAKHDKFLLNHYNTGKSGILNNTRILPMIASDGFINPSWVHIKMNPFVEKGISYISVIKPLKNPKRMVLVRRDGTIDAMCRDFAKDMNILSAEETFPSMYVLCPGFKEVNTVFNKVAFQVLKESMSQTSTSNDVIFGTSKLTSLGDFTKKYFQDLTKTVNDSQSFPEATPVNSSEVIHKSNDLYQNFTTGAKLTFFPQKDFTRDGNKIRLFLNQRPKKDRSNPVFYQVQIMNDVHTNEKDFIKILIMERIKHEEEEGNTVTCFESTERQENLAQYNSNWNFLSAELKADPETTRREVSFLPPATTNRPLISNVRERQDSLIPNHPHNHDVTFSDAISIPEELAPEEHVLDGEKVHFTTTARREDAFESPIRIFIQDERRYSSPNKHQTQPIEEGKQIQSSNTKDKSSEEANKDPNLGENLMRKKLKNLRERLNHVVFDIGKREYSRGDSSSSGSSRVPGLIAKALALKSKKSSAYLFGGIFILLVLIVLALQSVQSYFMFTSITSIKQKSDIFDVGVFRLDSLVTLTFQSAIYLSVLKGEIARSGNWSLDTRSGDPLPALLQSLISYNNVLWDRVSHIGEEYQQAFYNNDVASYYRDNNTLLQVSQSSNFQAMAQLIYHASAAANLEIPPQWEPDINVSDLQFIVDNAFNDLLTSSENATSYLGADLQKSLNTAKSQFLTLFLLIGFTLLILVGFTLHYLYRIRIYSLRFMNVLFRLSLQDAQESQLLLQQFKASLENNIRDFEIAEQRTKGRLIVKDSQQSRGQFRWARMEKLYRKYYIAFAKLAPFYLLIFGWVMGFYLFANGRMGVIEKQQEQIQVSLEILYQQNLLVTSFIIGVLTRGTATMEGKPILEETLEDAGMMQQVDNILGAFRASDGSLPPDQQEIFFNFPCSSFEKYPAVLNDEVMESCEAISGEAGHISFAEVFVAVGINVEYYYHLFVETDMTPTEFRMMFATASNQFEHLMNLNPALCKILYQTTADNFVSGTENAKSLAVVFTAMTAVGVVGGAVLCWAIIIQKIFEFELMDRVVLQLLPVKVILGNKHLKQYLFQISQGVLQAVRSFLQ